MVNYLKVFVWTVVLMTAICAACPAWATTATYEKMGDFLYYHDSEGNSGTGYWIGDDMFHYMDTRGNSATAYRLGDTWVIDTHESPLSRINVQNHSSDSSDDIAGPSSSTGSTNFDFTRPGPGVTSETTSKTNYLKLFEQRYAEPYITTKQQESARTQKPSQANHATQEQPPSPLVYFAGMFTGIAVAYVFKKLLQKRTGN
ncbi:hypothetical protein [Desulfofundulus sp.]|uniref:hypothetical protein n=1 Tax=Desulfofundulus sp. TaxID=2282750 RepID=UPI003C7101A7